MKRMLAVLLSMALLLSGCGATKQTEPEIAAWQEYFDLGVRYLSENNYEKAILAFTKVIEIEPNNVDAYFNRAEAYQMGVKQLSVMGAEYDIKVKEYLENARKDYEKVAELDPERAEEVEEKQNIVQQLAKELENKKFFDENNTDDVEQKIQIALMAYAKVLYGDGWEPPGVYLDCDGGIGIEATHYQLLDMNGDAVPEIIFYAIDENGPIPVFEIYAYFENDGGTVIADSLNTCDLSRWWNVGFNLCIMEDQCQYVVYEASKSLGGYSSGTAGMLEYDGITVTDIPHEINEHRHNAPGEAPCEVLVEMRGIVGGIEIGSDADVLLGYNQIDISADQLNEAMDKPYVGTWVCSIDFDGYITNEINLNKEGTVKITDYDGTYRNSAHVWNSAEGTWKLLEENGNTYWIELQLSYSDTSDLGNIAETVKHEAVIEMELVGDYSTIQLYRGEYDNIFYDYPFERK